MTRGYAIQRFFDTRGAVLDTTFRILGNPSRCRLFLLIFEESAREDVFPDTPNHETACCPLADRGDWTCLSSPYLIKRVFENATDSHSTISVRSPALYSIVLINCSPDRAVASGSISIRPFRGFLDGRLWPLVPLFLGIAWATVSYGVLWSLRLFRTNPNIVQNQVLFIVSISQSGIGCVLFSGFLVLWDVFDIQHPIPLVVCGFFIGLSRAILCFLVMSALQHPLESALHPFLVLGVLFGAAFALENMDILKLPERRTGRWKPGFGLLATSLFSLAMIGRAFKSTPPESVFGDRQIVFVTFAIAVLVFAGSATVTWLVRSRMSLLETKPYEWFPFVLEPAFYIVTAIVTGWFWIGFNPQGWEMLENEGDDIAALGDAEEAKKSMVGSGFTPDLGTRPEFVVDEIE
jgi:hypothetical protein